MSKMTAIGTLEILVLQCVVFRFALNTEDTNIKTQITNTEAFALT